MRGERVEESRREIRICYTRMRIKSEKELVECQVPLRRKEESSQQKEQKS